MYSLQSYTEQCYNIGSPKPTPVRKPFEELPSTQESEFDFSPNSTPKINQPKTHVTTRKQLKRKLVIHEPDLDIDSETSPKRAKIMNKKDKEDFMTFLAEQSRISSESITRTLQHTFKTRMDTLENQIKIISTDTKTEISKIGTNLKEIKDNTEAKLASIQNEFGELKHMVTETVTNNLEELKVTLVPIIKDEVVKDVRAELKSEFNAVDAIWKANLAEKVWEAEHNLLVFNYNVSKAPIEEAREFLEIEMKVSGDSMSRLHLKRASRLGKGKNNKPPPLLIQFSHPSDRNHVLSHSKNLKGRPYKVEKDVPKLYKKTHGEFKEEAWKLREHFEYQTDISFNGHLMILQYKSRGNDSEKFHYINHMEWSPPPREALSLQRNSKPVPQGTVATPPINLAVKAKAECSIFMSGMKTQLTADSLSSKFNEILKPEHKELVTEIKLKRPDLAIIYCNTWESCKLIVAAYNEFNGERVTFKMFSNAKPNARNT